MLFKRENIEQKRIYQKIGRRNLFQGIVISFLFCFIVLPVAVSIILLLYNGSGSIDFFYQNLYKEVEANCLFISIQVIVLFSAVWCLGPMLAKQILEKKENYYTTSALNVFLLWLIIFVSSSITSGIQSSIVFGIHEFSNTLTNWFIFGFISFTLLGILHGLLIGFFIGKRIIKDSLKQF